MQWQCRIAPSLGTGFSGTPQEVWGVIEYTDPTKPCVFFGLYSMKDFNVFTKHTGRKAILWCGSDIRHFVNGYWLNETGEKRVEPKTLVAEIQKAENYVENDVEYRALKKFGIESHVVPSFLGNVDEYKVEYQLRHIKLYTSVSGNDFELYGWHKIPPLAKANPEVEFHLYGNTKEWTCTEKNILIHGRIPIDEMNSQVQKMSGALRLTEFDGFSEIIAKSFLWGQYPVSIISYPYTVDPQDIDSLWENKYPNKEGRAWVLNSVNKYPWNVKNN